MTSQMHTHPQGHACFIQSLNDDLVNEGGIFDLVVREARVFKYGRNWVKFFHKRQIRKLRWWKQFGLMSFKNIRSCCWPNLWNHCRAAKMVIVNADHPKSKILLWKVEEESKVADLYTGSRLNSTHLNKLFQLQRK